MVPTEEKRGVMRDIQLIRQLQNRSGAEDHGPFDETEKTKKRLTGSA